MKRMILASILSLGFAASLCAQPKSLFGGQMAFPPKLAPRQIELVRGIHFGDTGVCSVPLTEAHLDVNDPGIASTLGDSAVAIPHANVPAPACESQTGLLTQTWMLQGPSIQLLAPHWPAILDPRALKLDVVTPRQGKAPNIDSLLNEGVCSVPLLEAHADAIDPGIAANPVSSAVPIPRARVPAPPCKK